MNESKLTIRWMRNEDGCSDISVCSEVDSYPYFKEAFLSLEKPIPIYDIKEDKTNYESAANSAITILLSNLFIKIGKGIKSGEHILRRN